MNESPSSRNQKKMTMRQVLLAIVLLMLAAGALFWIILKSPLLGEATATQNTSVRPLPVNVMTVEFVESVQQARNFTGTIRAKNRSELGFELSGKIKHVFVDEGDQISTGVEIAELDTETLVAQKNAMLASIEQAENVLAELQTGPREEIVKAARANRDAARSQYELAKSNLKRRKSLRDDGAISIEEFDRASFALLTAEANLQAAEERLAELEAGTRLEKVAAQKSAVKQLQASLEEIEVAIRKSTLTAPFAGTITRRHLDPGTIAQASVPVVRLVDEQNLEAWIGLPVSTAAELVLHSTQEITVEGKSYSAKLKAKIRELDQMTRTQTVVLELEPQDTQSVVSGQLCELRIESKVQAAGFWVPTTALTKGVRGLWSVMTLEPDSNSEHFRLRKRDVEVIHTESNRVLVKGTLEDGIQIVADGVHRVASGQLVEIQSLP